MAVPRLVSIQVGMPAEIAAADGRSWVSAIFKTPVAGPVWLDQLNLEGDGQADRRVHGGPDKAVLAYSADHYPFWRGRLPDIKFTYGAFGENFTIAGLTEDKVCIGDIYRVGQALIQVTQPRQPCWKLARKIGARQIGPLVIETGYSGWYFRVVEEGRVESGFRLTLVERPHPERTIRRVNEEVHAA